MSYSEILTYPPVQVLRSNNNEYKILWMLKNNNICRWKNFLNDPLNIKEATLQYNLNKLISNGLVIKNKKAKTYLITQKGKERLKYIFSLEKDLVFPHSEILRKEDIEDNILWMVKNNKFCQWKDFTNKPFNFHPTTLSNKLKNLIRKRLITKEFNIERSKGVYEITTKGESKYIEMLKDYNLDPKTLRKEKIQRLKEINKKNNLFFKSLDIYDHNIKFRFNEYVSLIEYSKYQEFFLNQGTFNLLLLFLAINHPNNYPNYISIEDFSKKYDIDMVDLNFYLKKLTNSEVVSLRFFQINPSLSQIYYFHEAEKLERIIRILVEDYVDNKILSFIESNKFDESVEILSLNGLKEITTLLCDKYNLIHSDLRRSIEMFLIDYLDYLVIDIKKKEGLLDSKLLLKGISFLDLDKSKIPFTALSKENLNECAGLFNQAISLAYQDNNREALNIIVKSIELNPYIPYAYYILSIILFSSGNSERSLEPINHAIKLIQRAKQLDANLDITKELSCYRELEKLTEMNLQFAKEWNIVINVIQKLFKKNHWNAIEENKLKSNLSSETNFSIEIIDEWLGAFVQYGALVKNENNLIEITSIGRILKPNLQLDGILLMKATEHIFLEKIRSLFIKNNWKEVSREKLLKALEIDEEFNKEVIEFRIELLIKAKILIETNSNKIKIAPELEN